MQIMRKIDPLKRKAVLWHLALSAVLTIGLAIWLLSHWFPAPYSFAAGVLTGLLIVASVDLCLGPLLTLLLIHSKKSVRENLLDGLLVAFLQFSALGYGLWQVSLARPAAVVFWQDSFYLVKAFNFHEQYGEVPELGNLSSEQIPLLYARYPLLLSELQQFEQSLKNGLVPYVNQSLYRPVQEGLTEIAKSPVNMQILLQKYPELQQQLDQLGDKNAQVKFIYSRLKSDFGNFLLVLQPDGGLLGVITLPF